MTKEQPDSVWYEVQLVGPHTAYVNCLASPSPPADPVRLRAWLATRGVFLGDMSKLVAVIELDGAPNPDRLQDVDAESLVPRPGEYIGGGS